MQAPASKTAASSVPNARRAQSIMSPVSTWNGPTNIATFVRCLRLLDLDLREDWPGVNEQLFSLKGSQQSLQQRVKCVEWSLYRLFDIWDPEYTTDKLRPFFPPLAPLQSLNLRAALYRGLTELKKNGVLGKEAILRKSMLDECKGDKFEEAMSVFAMAVLRKEARQKFRTSWGNSPGYASGLLSAEHLTSMQRVRTMPLIIAHAHSLRQQLIERHQISEKFHDQVKRLDDSRAILAERRKTVTSREAKLPIITPGELESISDHVRAAWTGNDQWAETLIHGGPGYMEHFLLEELSPAGKHQQSGALELELSTPRVAHLVTDLNEKLRRQQCRLQKLTEFRTSLEESYKIKKMVTPNKREAILKFGSHQELQPDQAPVERLASPRRLPEARLDPPTVIEAMRAELASIRRARGPGMPSSNRLDSRSYSSRDLHQKHEGNYGNDIGELSPGDASTQSDTAHENATTNHFNDPAARACQDEKDGVDAIALSSHLLHPQGLDSKKMIPYSPPGPGSSSSVRPVAYQDGLRSPNPPLLEAPDAKRQDWSTSQTLRLPPNRMHEGLSSPSLSKGRLASLPPPCPISDDQAEGQPSVERKLTIPIPEAVIPSAPASSPSESKASTLLERTRLSMAALPSSFDSGPNRRTSHVGSTRTRGLQTQTPKHARRRPSTINPINQCPTPRRKPDPPSINRHRRSTLAAPLAEAGKDGRRDDQHGPRSADNDPYSSSSPPGGDPFDDQADYESVFRSRPKVALSPPGGSPERGGGRDGARLDGPPDPDPGSGLMV